MQSPFCARDGLEAIAHPCLARAAYVDGIDAKNGTYRLVFILFFTYTTKMEKCNLHLGVGRPVYCVAASTKFGLIRMHFLKSLAEQSQLSHRNRFVAGDLVFEQIRPPIEREISRISTTASHRLSSRR